MLSCSLYSSAAIRFLHLVPLQSISSRHQLIKIVFLLVIFSFSIVAGNKTLRYIPVSFNQAIGTTTPFFTAIFAFALTCHREQPLVYLSLLSVVLGIILGSNSEPLFHLFGFLDPPLLSPPPSSSFEPPLVGEEELLGVDGVLEGEDKRWGFTTDTLHGFWHGAWSLGRRSDRGGEAMRGSDGGGRGEGEVS